MARHPQARLPRLHPQVAVNPLQRVDVPYAAELVHYHQRLLELHFVAVSARAAAAVVDPHPTRGPQVAGRREERVGI